MRVIALGRFIYGVILLAAGLVIFNLLGKNLSAELLGLMTKWHIDTHLYFVHWLFANWGSRQPGTSCFADVCRFFLCGPGLHRRDGTDLWQALGVLAGDR